MGKFEMKIIKTFFNQYGAIQIQDHGAAFLVSYPDINNAGFTKEKIFNKYIGDTAWNDAQKFAARKRMEADK
tara:strand:- start:3226 stop:3441 length:216 start_codon:yes stop_codon:yes gene_type:complete